MLWSKRHSYAVRVRMHVNSLSPWLHVTVSTFTFVSRTSTSYGAYHGSGRGFNKPIHMRKFLRVLSFDPCEKSFDRLHGDIIQWATPAILVPARAGSSYCASRCRIFRPNGFVLIFNYGSSYG